MKKTITYLFASILVVFAIGIFFIPIESAQAKSIDGLETPVLAAGLSIPQKSDGISKCGDGGTESCMSSVALLEWLTFFINLFVLIVIIGSSVMIAWGGLEYITSAGVPDKAKAAKDKIKNVLVGMLCLIFMWAFLQWLIPGGAQNIDIPNTTTPIAKSTTNNGSSNGSGGGEPTTIPETSVTTLDQVENFRDAGGSGFLKSGVLYRSAKLDKASPAQIASLLGSGGMIIDLRKPTKTTLRDPSVAGVTNKIFPIEGTTDYAKFVTDSTNRAGFKDAINAIANADGKVLLHCTFGKDRTGWTVAMIMYALGASDAQVKSEYLKSGSGVNTDMLNVGLSKAKAKYGSIDKYISKGLGISDSTIAKLKAKLGN